MTQTIDLIKKMAEFFKGEEFYEKGEDARLELSPDDVRCMNYLIQQRNKALEQEPKTGHWIEHPEIETSAPEYLMFYECSECGDKQCFCKSDIHKKRFCNNCGAKMVEPQESEG